MEMMIFSTFLENFTFFFRIFLGFFFDVEKNIFSEELRIFWGYSFDAENCNLSISKVFRLFGARQIRFLDFSAKYVNFLYNLTYLVPQLGESLVHVGGAVGGPAYYY